MVVMMISVQLPFGRLCTCAQAGGGQSNAGALGTSAVDLQPRYIRHLDHCNRLAWSWAGRAVFLDAAGDLGARAGDLAAGDLERARGAVAGDLERPRGVAAFLGETALAGDAYT